MLGLLGRKMGMSQMFGKDGSLIPVTVIEAGPCTVVQKKTKETDGYDALQLGFDRRKTRRMPKARRLHCEKKNLPFLGSLKEFRTEKAGDFAVGQELTVKAFKAGDVVDVEGTSKGRGFQGVMRRHGKHGGPMSHGSDFHRRTGSIGMRTWPGRIFKNTKLPGHMGAEKVTIKNLDVVDVRPEENLLMIRGCVPGARGRIVVIINRTPDFENREELLAKAKKEAAPAEGKAKEETPAQEEQKAEPKTEKKEEKKAEEKKE